MHSCLYEGWVRHKRWSPVEHGFKYRLAFWHLDLDELEQLTQDGWWPTRPYAPLRICRADHVGPAEQSLADAVRAVIAEAGEPVPGGPIRLLTQPRCLGYVFNPVSFFFCFDECEALRTVVAEVHNTPWGERHCYVLPQRAGGEPGDTLPLIEKQFHVSPFLPPDMQYRWRLSAPGEHLTIGIENLRQGERVFQAVLRLDRRPLTTTGLMSASLRYPLQAQRVLLAIYWQAFLLWRRGCPTFPHPTNMSRPTPLPSESAP